MDSEAIWASASVLPKHAWNPGNDSGPEKAVLHSHWSAFLIRRLARGATAINQLDRQLAVFASVIVLGQRIIKRVGMMFSRSLQVILR